MLAHKMNTELAHEIFNAFGAEIFPPGETVSIETYDDEGANENFRGTHWRDHQFSELENLPSCLTFFTPRAFCFFLPSFLLASLEEPTSGFASEVAERLCAPKNDPSRPSFLAWWSLLTREQRSVIVAFLHVMQSKHGAIPHADISRLKAYRVV